MIDPIVEEVRAARDALAAKFNYDIHALAENARRHQAKSGYKILKAPHPQRQKKRIRGATECVHPTGKEKFMDS